MGILSISAISHMVQCWSFSINVSIWSLSALIGLPDHGGSSSEKSQAQKFANYFWHVWSVTAPSPYTTQIFLQFSCVFTFLEIIKNNIPKIIAYFLPSLILKRLHKNSPILIHFLMHADTTAVTIQSNGIVSNDGKDN